MRAKRSKRGAIDEAERRVVFMAFMWINWYSVGPHDAELGQEILDGMTDAVLTLQELRRR